MLCSSAHRANMASILLQCKVQSEERESKQLPLLLIAYSTPHLIFTFSSGHFSQKNDIGDVGSTADFADVSDFCCFSLILDTPGTCGPLGTPVRGVGWGLNWG